MWCQHDSLPWTAQGRPKEFTRDSQVLKDNLGLCKFHVLPPCRQYSSYSDIFAYLVAVLICSQDFMHFFTLFFCPEFHFLLVQPWIGYLHSWSFSAWNPWKLWYYYWLLSCESKIHQNRGDPRGPHVSHHKPDHKSVCATQACSLRLPQMVYFPHVHSLAILSLKKLTEFNCQSWEVLDQEATVSLL